METNNSISLPPDLAARRVLNLRCVANWAGLSVDTLRREIAAGRGPKVVQLSARRIGVRADDALAWIDSRTQPDAA